MRPGYSRVQVSGSAPASVLLTAFFGPDETVVVVAIDHAGSSADFEIGITGASVPSAMTPFVTSASDDLDEKSPVSVSAGRFAASLPATSVTTFVGM